MVIAIFQYFGIKSDFFKRILIILFVWVEIFRVFILI